MLLPALALAALGAGCHPTPQAARPPAAPALGAQKPEGRYLSAAEVAARQTAEVERGIRFPKLVCGNPALKTIALTFDDGPHPLLTDRLLDILKREGVKATFFVVGKMVDQFPDLVRREAAEGHEVANHTYHHYRLPTLAPALIPGELQLGAQAIRRAIGTSPRLYRPPGGEYDDDVIDATKRLGYTMVLWTDDPGDYASPGDETIRRIVLKRASNGGIILLHDGIQQTLDVLPGLIEALKKRGFTFVTCAELAREHGVVKAGGPRVRLTGSPTFSTSARTPSKALRPSSPSQA